MKQAISKVFETAPYVRSRITTGDLMYFVVLALLPCAGMGIYRYGFHAALLIGIGIADDEKPEGTGYATVVGVYDNYDKTVADKCNETSYGCLYSYEEMEVENNAAD